MLPAARELLVTAAATFDAVAYGDRVATAGDHDMVRRADETATAARPVELAGV
jgi:hypothetical protein